jgi:Protein of unknown function/AsmA-like C-terminal region
VTDTEDMQDWTEPDDDLIPPPPEPPPPPRRRGRLLLWALEAIGAVVGALVLAMVLIAVRLEFGPIEVDFLTPMLVAYLNAKADPLSVRIDGTSLSWTAGRSTLDVIGSGLKVADPSGNEIVSIPKLSVSINLRALLAGHLAASRIAVLGPRLRLIRAKTGEIGVDLGADTPAATAEPALAEAPPSLQELWRAFSGKPSANLSLSYLDRISILQADITVDDRHAGLLWHAGDGEINFTRRSDGLDAQLSGAVGIAQTQTHLFGHIRYVSVGESLSFALSWDGTDPSKLSAALPAPYDAAAAQLRLPIAGQARGEIGLADKLLVGPLHLRLDAGAGALADPFFAGGRLDLTALKLEADYLPAEHRLKLGQLQLDLGGPSIELGGSVDRIPADPLTLLAGPAAAPMTISANIVLHAMPIDRLGTYWPPSLAGNTRNWVTTHLSAGAVDDLHSAVTLSLEPGADPPVQAGGFAGTMTIKGANVVYVQGLPPVEAADANVSFQPKRLEFDISAGHLKTLAISQGSVVIDEFGAPFERTTIDIALAGPARDVMTVLDSKPLQYAKALGIDPNQIGGTVDGLLHFRFPLKIALPIAEVEYGASARLTGLALGHAALGRDLSDGNFALTLDPLAVTLDGTAKLDGLAGTINLKQRLSGTAGPREEVRVKTVFDDAARKRFDLDFLPDNVHGPLGTDLVYTEFDSHHSRAAVALDLGPAILAVDEFGWHKPAGQAAHGEFNVEFADGRPTRLTELTLRGPRLEIKGELTFAGDGRLIEAHAPKFRLGETDAALTLAHPAEAWQIGLHGPVVDLSEPLKQFKAKPGEKRDGPGPTVAIDVESEQIVVGPDRVLRNAQLTATLADHTLAEGKLSAGIGHGGKLAFQLDGVEAGGAFSLSTDDFGALLKVADISDDVVGGRLAISGRSTREAKGRRFSGRAEGADYRFTGAPFMVRLLSIASLSSIQTLLAGDGIPFSTLKADLSLYDGKLGLSHARAYGGAMGVNVDGSFDLDAGKVDLDGTLVPAYTLNSVLGNVPILGDLLMGGEGQGLFAANFRMGGQIEKPTITVNPLSPLAPGFLRNLFLFDAPEPDKEGAGK